MIKYMNLWRKKWYLFYKKFKIDRNYYIIYRLFLLIFLFP